ncbi:DUF2066 domain-containing protein [Methylophaga lonarensis]|uniref:DUF2066 domain-containing protein n=1 Tax=Methylophaga lonarensis TaxID=999151 RepID=UPI003D26D1DF
MHRLILALILLPWMALSHASAVSNLYQATAAVESQSEADRKALTPELLRKVLLKIVGDSGALEQADLSALMEDADRFVQQYHYARINVDDDWTQPDQLALTLTFDETSLSNAINRTGLPQWGLQRPEVLIWVAIDDGEQRQLVSEMSDAHDVIRHLKQAGQERAMPIFFPVMDLQDQTQLTFNDIWTGDNDAVRNASERYGASVIAVARVQIRDEDAQVSWQALINDETLRWQSEGRQMAAIKMGLGELTDQLARKMGQVVSSGPQQEIEITVTEVRDFSDYSRVLGYLNRLPAVSSVSVINLADNELRLALSIRGEPSALRQTLAFGQVLRSDGQQDEQQRYRLLP